MLAHELAGKGITVSSAGTGALVGAPVDVQSASRITGAGAVADEFAARQITRDIVAAADLVISATRDHLSTVVPLYPRALRYSFALHDLGDLLTDVTEADIEATAGANRVAKVAAAAIAKRGTVSPRLAEDSGIIDPFQRDAPAFDQMVAEVSESLPAVVSALRGATASQVDRGL
ncbi:hypothetical protein N801_17100 [Knoellia aerolata DSM 18566]|uniref:Phosphotyrosine protein phosphatase I domain-containing protein n=1 Tax=Knoellia aerolata DSM 18566 TaxID=1385519 RepID=A0A0A0JYX9_9MICO|nr:hypothetical protein N801_17100 [Knoellia aerolata DSM 18566]